MTRSFSLSLTAVDVLLEHCQLGRAPFPFEIPHVGRTRQQRDQVRQAVFRDLEGRGLVRGGQIDGTVHEVLRTFVHSFLAITLVAQLRDDDELFARGVRDGDFAVVVRQDGNLLVFEEARPTTIVSAVVGLLPTVPAGPGQSVTVAGPAAPHVHGRTSEDPAGPPGPVTATRPPASSTQLRAVQRLFDKPQLRIGQLAPFVRGREGGKRSSLDPVAWFDNEDGRYFCTSRVADDGQKWLTYAPADHARMVQHLHAQLESLG